MGLETDESICNDYGTNIHAHESCGRPLGLRFKTDNPDFLYFVDAYYGLLKIDLKQGTYIEFGSWLTASMVVNIYFFGTIRKIRSFLF